MSNKTNEPRNQEVKLQNSLAFDQIAELLHNKRKLFWLNVKTGFVRGFAGVLGAALAIVVIGFLVSALGGLPVIGQFLHTLNAATTK
ncbi:hypothetical protein HYX70_02875 [Candidatus Saccharibacteria bacterium]|nr:hypothetical protein [Candidatus Saccharibacteria bacterium]